MHAREAQSDCPVGDALWRAVNGLCGRKRQVRNRAELCQEKYVTESKALQLGLARRRAMPRSADVTTTIPLPCLLLVFSEHSIIARTNTVYSFPIIYRPVRANERGWYMRTSLHRHDMRKQAGSSRASLLKHMPDFDALKILPRFIPSLEDMNMVNC